jgi:tripartite-type tricarboxylate transporter receptor subunit TctC
MNVNLTLLFRLLLALALTGVSAQSPAQTFPTKPIRLIVGAGPGAGIDALARMVAHKAAQGLGQPIVVENMAGASGTTAATAVTRAAADGYTLLVGHDGSQSAHLYQSNLAYNPSTDFAPITGGGLSMTCIAVNASLPVNSIAELVDYAKRNPGKLSFGSGGGTTRGALYLGGEYFKSLTGTDFVGVPYKSMSEAATELLGGRVTMAVVTVAVAMPQLKAGKAKILAILENKRYPNLPNIPTLGEAVPGFLGASTWNGYFAPAATPAAVIRRLNAEMVSGLNAADESKLPGITLIGGTPEEFGRFVSTQVENLARLLKLAGVERQ